MSLSFIRSKPVLNTTKICRLNNIPLAHVRAVSSTASEQCQLLYSDQNFKIYIRNNPKASFCAISGSRPYPALNVVGPRWSLFGGEPYQIIAFTAMLVECSGVVALEKVAMVLVVQLDC